MTRMRVAPSWMASTQPEHRPGDRRAGCILRLRETRKIGTALQINAWSRSQKSAFFLIFGLLLQTMLGSAFAQSLQPRIAVLLTGFPIRSPETEQFRQGLRALKYTEGKNVILEWRSAEGNYSHLPRLLEEIIDWKPDIIVVEGTAAALQVSQEYLDIPVVMAVVSDPLASGLVESLTRPGGDITGLSMMTADITARRLELLKESIPSLKRVGVLLDASLPWHESSLAVLVRTANERGMELTSVRVAGIDGIALAFAELRRAQVEAVYVLDSALLGGNVDKLLTLARRARLPVVCGRREWVEKGALLSYSANFGDMFRRSAKYVDRILKGEKAADLPIEQPIDFELAINLKTAKALKLAIPASIVERANQVVP